MRVLSIRQPYAEEILRKIKKVEFRDHRRGVRIGERFYIYAAKSVPTDEQLRGYSKLCKTRKERKAAGFPVGVIVGTARISKVTPPTKSEPHWHWHLTDVRRVKRAVKPKNHPQSSWFYPF